MRLAFDGLTIRLRAMHKVTGWFRKHPVIAVLAVIVLGCVGGHYFLNWRAERRWQAYAVEARARGVKLALTDFERPEIPDAENFAALPMMRAIFTAGAKSPMELPATGRPSFGDPLKGERFDWESGSSISRMQDSSLRRRIRHRAMCFA